MIFSISLMAITNPANGIDSLTYMAIAAVLLGFSSATQDIVIDAFRIESAEEKMQAILSATYIAGYRIGMLVAGAGPLYLASYFGTSMTEYSHDAWKWTYLIMAGCMLVGVLTVLLRPEPAVKLDEEKHSVKDYLVFFGIFVIIAASFIFVFFQSADLTNTIKGSIAEVFGNKALGSFLAGSLRLGIGVLSAVGLVFAISKTGILKTDMIEQGYLGPIRNFFERYKFSLAITLLALVGLYRISDIVLGVISNVFYQDLGFTKVQIADVVKTFGLFMALLGGFVGGILTNKLGVYRMLFGVQCLQQAPTFCL